MKSLKQDCWLINSTANIHFYNDQKLLIDFMEKLTRVKRSIANNVLPRHKIVLIKFALKNKSKKVILNL